MILDFINLHKVFYFLGTIEGSLAKVLFEFFLFLLITYMIISEYNKYPRKDLKYFIAAFGAISFEKLVSSVLLLGIVFGELGNTTYLHYFPVIDNTLSLFALILLVNAFLFPLTLKRYKSIRKNVLIQLAVPAVIYVIFQASLILEIIYSDIGRADHTNYISGLIFTLCKLVLLMYAIYMLSTKTDIRYKYRYSVVVAFLVYFVTPFLRLINLLFYKGLSQKLIVAGHPFPLLAVILFTRVIYLKLVDKALLKRKLRKSEEKYVQEKELSQLKDKFVSIVSHELRTPLTSISLYSTLLKQGKFGKMNKKQKESADVIKNEAARLSGLINEVLDLSKLEDKKVKLKIDEFDLYELFKYNPSESLAVQKGVKLVSKVRKGFMIKGDKEKLKQVMINLLSNAIKYTDKGGKVTITAESKKDKWEISIADTGVGIGKEELDKIFDKFYQVEHHVTRKEGGSGLGLTIAYEIVKLHKGDIKVKSEVGKGSVFTVILPKSL